jgi:hypothetical protein
MVGTPAAGVTTNRSDKWQGRTNFYKRRKGRCNAVDVFAHLDCQFMNVSLNRRITEMTYQGRFETPSFYPEKIYLPAYSFRHDAQY